MEEKKQGKIQEINEKEVSSVQVLGSGCKSCHQLYENAKKAVQQLQLPVEVEYITDLVKIVEFGVMTMPAIVVNGQVVSAGKVLKDSDIVKLLK